MSNTSAVLEVLVENKEIASIIKDNKDEQQNGSTENSLSLALSPSLESFSTIQDVETLSELNMEENSDFYVKIDNPQKQLEILETFITFRVTTKVARIEFLENNYIVRRRYNDFLWLHQRLVDVHPFCIIPPLPEKHTLIGQLDRYSKDFIVIRMKALNIFMSRLIEHPILSCNDNLFVFLTSKPKEFSAYKKQRRSSCDHQTNIFKNSSLSHSVLKNRDLEFDKTKTYLSALSEKLASIEKISSRINKEHSEFVTELNNFHPIFTTWSMSEPELASILQGIGRAWERTAAAQNSLVQTYSSTLGHPIKDFLAYIDVVQETLKKRESYQQAYEYSVGELNKKHDEKDKLNSLGQNSQSGTFSLWGQASSDEKLEKINSHIPQLLKKIESDQDNLECANESLRSDLERWQVEKHNCIKKILMEFVKKQMEFEQVRVNSWEQVANDLMIGKSMK